MSRFLYLCLIVFLCSSCYTGRLKRAERKYNKKEYSEAALRYRKLYAKTSTKQKGRRAYLGFREGECYQRIKQTARALPAYQKAYLNDYPDAILSLRLAQVWHASGEYEKAAGHYSDYLLVYPDDELALYGLVGSEQSPEELKHPTRYQVEQIKSINTGQSDFSPMLYGKSDTKLIFTSTRRKNRSEKEKNINYMKAGPPIRIAGLFLRYQELLPAETGQSPLLLSHLAVRKYIIR